MRLSPRARKAALTAHVVASVGWLGGVLAFLALAWTGLRGGDALAAASSYVAMDLVARLALVPLAFAALASGLLMSFGTEWGLVRHHWVVAKLVLTVGATALFLVHLQPIAHAAAAARDGLALDPALRGLRVQLVVDAALAAAALLVATALSVAKPRGRTRWGRQAAQGPSP